MRELATVPTGIALPKYEDMCRAIAACYRFDEAKEIRDKAEALKAYSRQIRNREAEVQFAEIKVRAERRCGELLEVLKRIGGRAGNGEKCSGKPTIPDLGMSHMGAQRARMAAVVPEAVFEAHLTQHRERQEPVSARSVRMLGSSTEHRTNAAQRGVNAIEALSELPLTPTQFVQLLGEESRLRVLVAIATTRAWLDQVSSEIAR